MPEIYGLLLIGLVSLVGVILLVPLVQRVAVAYGITDNPNARKLHGRPTPYLGGVAIGITALLASAFLQGWRAEASVLVLGAAMVAIVGLVDDVRTVSPAGRVAVEATAGLLAASAGARVELTHGPLDWVLTILWLVLITNSFNLLDNMDGAAGIIASTTAVALAVAAALGEQWLVGSLAAVVAGSAMGFLRYNWHPAKIFMGDAGSLFLGYLIAAIALKLRFPVDHWSSFVAVMLLTGPALFDTTLVVISRVKSGHKIYLGSTDHAAHRLMALGLGQRSVALVLAGTCAVTSTLGIAVGRGAVGGAPAGAITLALGVPLLLAFLRMDMYRTAAAGHTPPDHTPLTKAHD